MGNIFFAIGWVVLSVVGEETMRRSSARARKHFEKGVERFASWRERKQLTKGRK